MRDLLSVHVILEAKLCSHIHLTGGTLIQGL